MELLKGKTAIVTGAGSGIGAATAAAFAKQGMNVLASDIRPEPLEAVRQNISSEGGQIATVVADVSDPGDVDGIAEAAERAFGEIHVAFNNAGVAMHGTPMVDIPVNDWRWVTDVNILGLVYCIRRFVPLLKKHGGEAHIVNTASIGGLQVNPNWLTGAYSMTKYAAVALSEALEHELAGTEPGSTAPSSPSSGCHGSRRDQRLISAGGKPCTSAASRNAAYRYCVRARWPAISAIPAAVPSDLVAARNVHSSNSFEMPSKEERRLTLSQGM